MVDPSAVPNEELEVDNEGKEDWEIEKKQSTTADQEQFDIGRTTAPMIVNVANP